MSYRPKILWLSDSEIEATSSEPLLRSCLGLNTARVALTVGFLLSFALVLLSAFLLVVAALHFLEFTGQTLDLILILVDLCLVHVQLSSHSFHLVGLLFQILLVDR